MPLTDNAVRVAAFKWLEEQVAMRGDVLSRERLQEGFVHDGSRIPLVCRLRDLLSKSPDLFED
jgi:hypothetical protein